MRHPSQRRRSDRATRAIATFFVEQVAGKPEGTVRRYEVVRQHLMVFLQTADVDDVLAPQQVSLVQQARRSGAGFFAVCDLNDMVACLPHFVSGEWLLPSDVDARTQVRLASRLVTWLETTGELNSSPGGSTSPDALASITSARRGLDHRAQDDHDHPRPGRRPHLRLIRGGRSD
jgi:hypothetical protein